MNNAANFLGPFHTDNLLRAGVLILIGYFIARILTTFMLRRFKNKMRPHQAMLLRRIVFLIIFLLFFASAMQQLNFHISALLGATGILTVALGIASQTSMSNLISGLFLIGEKPFEIGDYITVNNMTGEIVSIDTMSVRIRTIDNTMVRIPNETLVKSSIVNLSYFPTRRINMTIGIAYEEDITRAVDVLLRAVRGNPLCLTDPAPAVIVEGFGEYALNLQLQVWTRTEDRRELQSRLYQSIKEAFDLEHISMPCPARTLYTTVTPSPVPEPEPEIS